MAATPSTMLPLGTEAPDFGLPDTTGTTVQKNDFAGQPLVVAFICNHCPYVKHVIGQFSQVARKYQEQGVAVVAISSNDVGSYPEDSPEKMREFATENGFSFPYLYDESQEVARAYQASCTPDLFLFDKDHRLVYRGQFDGSRPGNDEPVTGADLTAAVEALVSGKPIPNEQTPSVGCGIKWKEGNTPPFVQIG